MNKHISICVVAAALTGTVAVAARGQEHVPVAAQAHDFAADFDALVERLDTAREAFHAKLRALYADFDADKATQDEKDAFEAKLQAAYGEDPAPKFRDEFKTLAVQAKGSEIAAKSWLKVIELAGYDDAAKPAIVLAVDTLLAEHLQGTQLEGLTYSVSGRNLGEQRFEQVMTTLREKSPHRAVQGGATFALAQAWMSDNGQTPERKAKAHALLVELREKFTDVAASYGGTYAAKAERVLFELEHLQVGMVAPDFESIDENGVKFKVSDYRGKVVVLDFWGTW